MRRSGSGIALLVSCALMAACGGAPPRLPDYSEWLHAGVDPPSEAEALIAGLERAGYVVTERIETERWIALEARRDPDQRAIRVITGRGASLVLDSHEPDGLIPRHGAIALFAPPRAPSHDLDGDGTDEIVIAAELEGRACLLPFRIDGEGAVSPLPPDMRSLGEDVCVESFRDVEGDARPEGIAVLRFLELARAGVPSIEAPLELDAEGRLRASTPSITYLAEQRARLTSALEEALRAPDPEAAYRLAIELAALARLGGGSIETQLAAFDRAIARAVLTRDMVPDVLAARAYVERGWRAAESESTEPATPPRPRAP